MAERGAAPAGRAVVVVVLLALLIGAVALGRAGSEEARVRPASPRTDGPAVPPADAVSTAWYCAAGTGVVGAADETVYVANLSPDDVEATVTVLAGRDAAPARRRLALLAYERRGVRVADVASTPGAGVIVEVIGGQAIVEHELRIGTDVAMSACAREPAAQWYFAAGGTERGSTDTLALFNPFGDDAIVDVTFVTDGGVQEPQEVQGFVVGRRSTAVIAIQDLVPRQERVATRIRARTGRIVVEQVRTFDGTNGRTGASLTLGATTPRREWTLVAGDAEPGTAAVVAVANFGLAPAEVEVSILLSGEGVLAPETVDVPSRSVVTFDPQARVTGGSAYVVVLRAQGATEVVAEAASAHASAPGAAGVIGASRAARRWALAGAPPATSAAVTVVNRAPRALTVELRALIPGDPDSPRSAPAQVVEPGKVAVFDLDALGIENDQVLVVSADGPIVAGRYVYAGGASLATAVPFGT